MPVQVHPDSPAPGPAYGQATGQQHDAWQRSIEYVAAETQPPTEAPHVVPAATPPGLLRAIDVVPAMPLGTPTMTMIANPIPAAPEYTVAPEYFVTPVREWEPRGNDEVKAVVSSPTILDTRETSSVRHIEESRAPTSLTDQVHQHLSTNLEQLRETGRVEVQMILHPPELGNVKLHLALDDGHLSVRFLVQNDAAKNALDHQMEPMRARFAEMGFSLGQFDVRRDGTSSSWQTPFDASADVRPASSTTGPEVQAATAKRGSSNGLIDVLA